MTISSLQRGVFGHPTGFFHQLKALRVRMLAAWRQHRTDRAFEGLSYETLKDIGFPSANTATEKPTR